MAIYKGAEKVRKVVFLLLLAAFLVQGAVIVDFGQSTSEANSRLVRLAGGDLAVEVAFTGDKSVHYYADAATAPAGMVLKFSSGLATDKAIYPNPSKYTDMGGTVVDVYSGSFTVYQPVEESALVSGADVVVSGIACVDDSCLPPFKITLSAAPTKNIPLIEEAAELSARTLVVAEEQDASQGASASAVALYFLLALVAGLSFNVMPCVWPVLPIAVQRLVSSASGGRKKLFEQTLAYSAGIVSFFAIFAICSLLLRLTTGHALNWSEHLRYPAVITGIGVLMVLFAMYMFGLFTIAVSASVAGGAGRAKGELTGTLVTGFFAALLSTPCSGAILAAVFLWAQAQSPLISTLVILLLGVGMALPYMLLVYFPAALQKLPRPGVWMERFRQAMGFLLLFIAVKMFSALSAELMGRAYMFCVVLAFAVWMAASWAGFGAKKGIKLLVRLSALAIILLAGLFLFSTSESLVDWNDYEQTAIDVRLKQGDTVLIKFTADWCSNCHILDRKVFQDSEVAEFLDENDVYAVLGDTTLKTYPATEALTSRFAEAGNVPLTVILKKDSEPVKLRGIYDKQKLFEALKD